MFKKIQKTLHAGVVLLMTFVFGWIAVFPVHAAPVIRYVKWNAGGANNGTSWANAYTDLQSALAAASSGTEIWVAAGTYKPTSGTNRAISFVLKKGVGIYGGFDGTETERAQRNVQANLTILSGDIGTGGVNSDNSYHVVFSSGVDNTARLSGFTITGGNANGGTYPFSGGGMLNKYGSSPALSSLIFDENTAYDTGGGLASFDESSPQLTNVIFTQNTAVAGGGMYSRNGSPLLNNVIFDGNTANTGGGLFTSADYSSLMNVTFSNNQADSDGGGMANHRGLPTLTNVTFSGNSADRYGGGMFADYYSKPTLTYVTIADNTAGSNGGGLSFTNNSDAAISNTILWDNTATGNAQVHVVNSKPVSTKNVIKGGCPSGVTCTSTITQDPLLAPLDDNGGFSQTMALLEDSSAIDVGEDAKCPETDQRGVERPQGSHCDIGAFEAGKPGAPILLSPANGAVAPSLQPTLDWKPSNPDVDHYRIQVATDAAFTALVVDQDNIAPSQFTFASNLSQGVKYFWRVRAINDGGDISGWSNIWNFRAPLDAPTLVSPTNGQSFLTDRVTFDWDVVPAAAQYILQVSAAPNFNTLLVNATLNGTQYSMNKDLPQNKTIYWRVRGKTTVVLGLWSATWSFNTGNPPSVPVLGAPANNALVKDYTPVFNWQDSTLPPSSTFKQYEIQVDDNNDFSSPVINATTTLNDITDSDFTPLSDLASNTKYYWRVRAVNVFNAQDHTSAWTTIRSFATIIPAPTPLTVVPNGGNPLQPSFEWDDATGPGDITNYTIQISNKPDFSTLIVNSKTVPSTYAMTKNLPAGKTLYVRVRVNGEFGPSDWTTVQFTTP